MPGLRIALLIIAVPLFLMGHLVYGPGKPTRLTKFTCLWAVAVYVGFAIVGVLTAGK
jgi:hypothetical protein